VASIVVALRWWPRKKNTICHIWNREKKCHTQLTAAKTRFAKCNCTVAIGLPVTTGSTDKFFP
jgi:hypothetical protein